MGSLITWRGGRCRCSLKYANTLWLFAVKITFGLVYKWSKADSKVGKAYLDGLVITFFQYLTYSGTPYWSEIWIRQFSSQNGGPWTYQACRRLQMDVFTILKSHFPFWIFQSFLNVWKWNFGVAQKEHG